MGQIEVFQELTASSSLTTFSWEQEKAYSEPLSNFQIWGPNATVLEFIQERAINLLFDLTQAKAALFLSYPLIDRKVQIT